MADKIQCPHCKLTDGIFNAGDGMLGCIKCGERFNPLVKKTYNKLEEEPMPKKRKCRNCGRLMNIVGDDLCGGCYFVVRGMTKGTPEYDSALAAAKKRFSDPNYKPTRGGYRKGSGTKIKEKSNIKVLDTPAPVQPTKPIQGASLGVLIAERNMYQKIVFKMNQAIEILSD